MNGPAFCRLLHVLSVASPSIRTAKLQSTVAPSADRRGNHSNFNGFGFGGHHPETCLAVVSGGLAATFCPSDEQDCVQYLVCLRIRHG